MASPLALAPAPMRADAATAGSGPAWSGLSSLLFLAVAAGLLTRADRLLGDPDTQWHIAVGRWIVANGAVPWTDLFSHTFAGQPWIAKEWASQVILFGTHAAAGWSGVVTLTILVLAATLAALQAWLSIRVRAMPALAAVLVAFIVLTPHILARPHLLAFPILVVWTIGLVSALERRVAPSPWLLLVMIVWVNLHGSYPIGLVIAGLLAGEGIFVRPRTEWTRQALRWAMFLLAATLAACVTPYGVRPFLVNFGLFGSGESLRYIIEWQPLALDLSGTVALFALALSLGALAPDLRRNLFRIAVLLLLGAMMIRHTRFADLFILVAPILIAGPAALCVASLRPEPRPRSRPSDHLIMAVLGLAALGYAATLAPRPAPHVTPLAALEAARGKGLTGPVYNDYDFGGFLIAEGVKTFIDGRADQIFLGGFMDALDRAQAASGAEKFAALLARHGITWAIVRTESRDAAHLRCLVGWTMLHEDAVAAVYYDARRESAAERS
ncbi:hypothetical protein [Methylobacterium iners]|nr:hypothetical protein [Methylobacterium iners]